MDRSSIRIVFLGTPDFAVASLAALVENNFNVVAVVTAPDKPAGRGMQLKMSAVKEYALSKDLPVLQPEKLKDPQFLATLADYKADLQVVVAFRMLPEKVWDMPRLGTVNVHGSLLPKYRGAAPINWAIINGETTTGVTTFRLKHEIDTGDILLQDSTPITDADNIGTIYHTLMHKGADLLIKTIDGLLDNSIHEKPQDTLDTPTHAPKIFKDDCIIHWENSAASIHNLIRGLSPVPTAFTTLDEKQFKIFTSKVAIEHHNVAVGTVDTDGKKYLRFAAADGWVYALDVQLQGKKRMAIEDFLRGYKF